MSIELQRAIRNNAKDMNTYLKDLYKWEDKIDKNPKTKKPDDIEYPVRKLETEEDPLNIDVQKYRKNKTTIKEYYKNWDQLNVDQELNRLDQKEINEKNNTHMSQEKNQLLQIMVQPKLWKQQGNQFFKEKKLKKALSFYQKIITQLDLDLEQQDVSEKNQKSINEFKVVILNNLAQVYQNLRQRQNVFETVDKILKIDSENAKAIFKKAKAFKLTKQYKKSKYWFGQGLEKSKNCDEKDIFLKQLRLLRDIQKVEKAKFLQGMQMDGYNQNEKRYFVRIKEDDLKKANKKVSILTPPKNTGVSSVVKDENISKVNFSKEKAVGFQTPQKKGVKREKSALKKSILKRKENGFVEPSQTFQSTSHDFLGLKNIDGKMIKHRERQFQNKVVFPDDDESRKVKIHI